MTEQRLRGRPGGLHFAAVTLAALVALAVRKPKVVRIGGAPGLEIDFTVTSVPPQTARRPPCVAFALQYLPYLEGKLGRQKGDRHRLLALTVKREVVIIDVIAPVNDFPAFSSKAEALLRTLRFRAAAS